MKTFQQPLAKTDEDYYLERLGDEDEEKKREAKKILIERNLRLVAHIAKKYQGTEVDMEDLISIGTVGLIKAVMSYDLDKNSKLGTYAARCIENEILMHFRARKKQSREVSIYEPIGTDKEGNETCLDKIDYLNKYRNEYKYKYLIEVDGGINFLTAPLVIEKGVDVMVVGSYLFNSDNMKESVDSLLK